MGFKSGGFNNIFARDYAVINLDRLQAAINAGQIDAGQEITGDLLAQRGLVKKSRDGVRLLGKGAIKSKVNVTVAGASQSVIEAVAKAGGKVTVTEATAEVAA